jgi:hypothetical protein
MRFNYEVIYQVNLYRTDDGSGAWYSSQFVSSSLLGTLSPAYPGTYYDFAFKASKSGITFRDDNSSNIPYTPKPDTLACNTKSIKINYVWFNDTLGVNKYEWIWGDRKSELQFPEIIFDKPGNYSVKLKISFMNDSSHNFSQLIIVPQCEKLESKTQINQTNNDLDIQVFPNPTDNAIYVHLKKQEIYKVIIMDALGQITYNNIINGSSALIDCKSMASGLYYIQIGDGYNNYFSKFIKL